MNRVLSVLDYNPGIRVRQGDVLHKKSQRLIPVSSINFSQFSLSGAFVTSVVADIRYCPRGQSSRKLGVDPDTAETTYVAPCVECPYEDENLVYVSPLDSNSERLSFTEGEQVKLDSHNIFFRDFFVYLIARGVVQLPPVSGAATGITPDVQQALGIVQSPSSEAYQNFIRRLRLTDDPILERAWQMFLNTSGSLGTSGRVRDTAFFIECSHTGEYDELAVKEYGIKSTPYHDTARELRDIVQEYVSRLQGGFGTYLENTLKSAIESQDQTGEEIDQIERRLAEVQGEITSQLKFLDVKRENRSKSVSHAFGLTKLSEFDIDRLVTETELDSVVPQRRFILKRYLSAPYGFLQKLLFEKPGLRDLTRSVNIFEGMPLAHSLEEPLIVMSSLSNALYTLLTIGNKSVSSLGGGVNASTVIQVHRKFIDDLTHNRELASSVMKGALEIVQDIQSIEREIDMCLDPSVKLGGETAWVEGELAKVKERLQEVLSTPSEKIRVWPEDEETREVPVSAIVVRPGREKVKELQTEAVQLRQRLEELRQRYNSLEGVVQRASGVNPKKYAFTPEGLEMYRDYSGKSDTQLRQRLGRLVAELESQGAPPQLVSDWVDVVNQMFASGAEGIVVPERSERSHLG